ncbi:palmitoleoyl-protein carboxylesterase NOTUM [Ostrinia furnacalis]|uniref:palmitoleoyl-protein carboxylesterase NOTUM n=1 Tax=Ostrinia furnacalis TaxID=93504 RepID=UPI00103FFB9F|nr:palmitoleoyl-protein carboxylesterase NOTUM [Ostrinia furnacalis]
MRAALRNWIAWTLCAVLTTVSASPPDSLKLVWLSNSSLTCNDGSPAGYYIRRGSDSSHWVVYLEGGGYCWDAASCGARWRRRPALMSSARWPRARRAPALLSADPAANPLWHASSHVLLPYCSSDMWAGTRARRHNASFAFAGALIVRTVLVDLLRLGLSGRLLLVGSSAGGAGVMLHADSARRALRAHGVRVAVLSDSGWFLDRPARARRVPAETVAKLGHSLWRGSPPMSCARKHSLKPWLCYFGYRLYPYIRTPLFVFQYLFDSAQLAAEGVRAPRTRAQWDAVHQTGAAIRASLKGVRATFAPACLAHGALARPEWLAINVSGVSLPHAIKCWERRLGGGGRFPRGGCAPRRLIERCSWPQCNGSCPRLRDPKTGEEVALAALLQSFGLDVSGAAAAMGLDARALSRMSRAELLPLLAPHT